MAGPRILFLTTVLPCRTSGGEWVTRQTIETLRGLGATLTVVGFGRPGETCHLPGDVEVVCAETRPIESASSRLSTLRWMLRAFLTRSPYSEAKFRSRRLLGAMEDRLPRADLVVIDHLQLGYLAEHIDHPRVVLIEHNDEAGHYEALARLADHPLKRWLYRREARRIRDREATVPAGTTGTVFLSADDRDAVAARMRQAVDATWNTVAPPPVVPDTSGTLPAQAQQRHDVLVFGNWTWALNRAGLDWFLEQVVPQLPPALRVAVAGPGLPAKIEGVEVLGFVSDLADEARHARILAIPSVEGTGIQIKTLQAIAFARPIVCTTPATRGIDRLPAWVHPAESAADFAQTITRLLAAPDQVRPADASEWLAVRQAAFVNEWANVLRRVGFTVEHAADRSEDPEPAGLQRCPTSGG